VGLPETCELPKGLSSRNTDDRIIAVALALTEASADTVTLVTNDLNMLLKAQTYHLDVERVETDEGFTRRFFVRPFQRYRAALGILAVAIAVFAASIYLTMFSPFAPGRQASGLSALPPEFLEQLSVEQQQALNYLFRLQSDPDNLDTLNSLATIYDNLSQQDVVYLPYAVKYRERIVELRPNDDDARTDLATDYFRMHDQASAIKELNTVLARNPDHVNANLNLGVMYMNQTPIEYQKAADQFARVIDLTTGKVDQAMVLDRARTMLEQVQKDADAAGSPVRIDGSVL
jgi:tetratricopeptide (TPR) repeat protein